MGDMVTLALHDEAFHLADAAIGGVDGVAASH